MREHYLRDDIYCGVTICKVCDSSAARLSGSTSSPILVLDTNVVLNQVKTEPRFTCSLIMRGYAVQFGVTECDLGLLVVVFLD